SMHQGTFQVDDVELREKGVVRIYDVFFDYNVLLDTDAFFREIISGAEFQRTMSTAEFHFLCGKYLRAREDKLGLKHRSLLAAAWEYGVPVYTSSPGDSSIGMNIAAKALEGGKLLIDVNADVNETAAIVWDAKAQGGKSAVWILGGGSPKNFLLQTEPQIQEVLGIAEKGHDRETPARARIQRDVRAAEDNTVSIVGAGINDASPGAHVPNPDAARPGCGSVPIARSVVCLLALTLQARAAARSDSDASIGR